MSIPGFPGPINPVGISHPRFYTFNECVPDVETSVGTTVQSDDPAWFQVVRFIENQQLHASGTAAVQREIDAIAFNRASKRVRRTLKTTQLCSFWLKRIPSQGVLDEAGLIVISGR